MFRDDFEFADGAAAVASWGGSPRRGGDESRSPACRQCPTAHRLGGRRREGAAENPVLRARQGATQHRDASPRSGVAAITTRDSLRCQSALRRADATPVGSSIVTMDGHLATRADRARGRRLRRDLPGLHLIVHAADEWGTDDAALDRCQGRHARGRHRHRHHAVHGRPRPRRDPPGSKHGATIATRWSACMSAGEVVRLTRLGKFVMSAPSRGAIALLKRLRGNGGSKRRRQGRK